ncbi:MAG TPA: hypothetical protein VLL07_00045, partial [Pontiella sp.]|nr:hypothetical protein [Pontiella sp.]
KIFPSPDMLTGASALVRAYGYGPLTPNTILLGDTENRENFTDFSELIELVYRTQRNLIMLRDSNDETAGEAGQENGHEEGETIHVWWGGNPDNIGLMLTLAYQIQKSSIWKQSKLVIKTIVASEEELESAKTRLDTFIEEQRIPAETEVLIKHHAGYFDMIRMSSADAGLVFMGMRPPREDESIEDYGRYYGTLIETTKNMPPLAFVLAAEPIEFQQLIGISSRD